MEDDKPRLIIQTYNKDDEIVSQEIPIEELHDIEIITGDAYSMGRKWVRIYNRFPFIEIKFSRHQNVELIDKGLWLCLKEDSEE
jgi:hypothetical protein